MFLEHTGENKKVGWIEVICGSMFSGKTEELIRRLKRAQFAKQRIKIFKPEIDTRYDDKAVVSHNQNTIDSLPVKNAKDILDLYQGAEVVGVDEAQFFDMELPNVCNELANNGIRVVVAGLDMDYLGNPFGPMPHLLAIAEYVTKVHAICMKTGKLANYSHRLTLDDDSQVKLGATDHYEPLSREAYIEAMEEIRRNKNQQKLFGKH